MKQLKTKWDLYSLISKSCLLLAEAKRTYQGNIKPNLEQATPDYSSTATPITAKTTQLSSYALSQAINELRALSLSSSRAYVMLFVIFLKSENIFA